MSATGERGSSSGRPTATVAYADRARVSPAALGETVAAPVSDTLVTKTASVAAPALTGGVRSTVLPRGTRSVGGAHHVEVEGKVRYETLRPLGAGGQAEVSLARDHDIDRPVALKRLLPERNDEASVLRFTEEIRTVGQLEHPNIVPIHDVGVDEEGKFFFVMKYVEGETLESIIGKLRDGDEDYRRRYSFEYRMQICNEILRGVEHAHQLGILHRDLKPGNVMIGSLGEVVVMDWGLAKRMAEVEIPAAVVAEEPAGSDTISEKARLFQTQAGALLGTPAYMAPEQAEGKAADARSDIYSLAVMFYEFLSLRHPRAEHETVQAMLASVILEPMTIMRVFGDFTKAGAPAALAHFVRHGLERDPAHRYQSVALMRQRLELVREGKAPIECHVTFTQRILQATSRAVNRHPFIVAASLLGVSVGVVVAGVELALSMAR